MMDSSADIPTPNFPASWSDELAFLALCARTEITSAAASRVTDLAKRISWDQVVRLSRFHRVDPLLYQTTREVCPAEVPEKVRVFLHRNYVTTAARNMRLVHELHTVRGKLEEAGIDALFFKGSVLAERVYRNLGLRSCTDIDFLIRRADLEQLQRIVGEIGYRPVKAVDSEGNVKTHSLEISGQVPFVHPDHPWSLDVHTALMPPGYSYPLDFDTLFDRSATVLVARQETPVFRAEDLLQILCLHGVKNRWEALKHVCDVAELLRSQQQLDWDDVLGRARKVRGERILFLGLKLAHDLLEAPVPNEVLAHVDRIAAIEELSDQVTSNLAHAHEQSMGERERMHFHLKSQDTLLNKARYALYVLRRRYQDS